MTLESVSGSGFGSCFLPQYTEPKTVIILPENLFPKLLQFLFSQIDNFLSEIHVFWHDTFSLSVL